MHGNRISVSVTLRHTERSAQVDARFARRQYRFSTLEAIDSSAASQEGETPFAERVSSRAGTSLSSYCKTRTAALPGIGSGCSAT